MAYINLRVWGWAPGGGKNAWYTVYCWDKQAEKLEKEGGKGKEILCECNIGTMPDERYKDQNGKPSEKVIFNAMSVTVAGKPQRAEGNSNDSNDSWGTPV